MINCNKEEDRNNKNCEVLPDTWDSAKQLDKEPLVLPQIQQTNRNNDTKSKLKKAAKSVVTSLELFRIVQKSSLSRNLHIIDRIIHRKTPLESVREQDEDRETMASSQSDKDRVSRVNKKSYNEDDSGSFPTDDRVRVTHNRRKLNSIMTHIKVSSRTDDADLGSNNRGKTEPSIICADIAGRSLQAPYLTRTTSPEYPVPFVRRASQAAEELLSSLQTSTDSLRLSRTAQIVPIYSDREGSIKPPHDVTDDASRQSDAISGSNNVDIQPIVAGEALKVNSNHIHRQENNYNMATKLKRMSDASLKERLERTHEMPSGMGNNWKTALTQVRMCHYLDDDRYKITN
jgi:hypothetical protein